MVAIRVKFRVTVYIILEFKQKPFSKAYIKRNTDLGRKAEIEAE